MAKPDLMPLPKDGVQVGEELKFPIFDPSGKLLLAAGQTVASERQLAELSQKGLFYNPAWAQMLVSSRKAAGTVKPSGSIYQSTGKKVVAEDPAESGRMLRMSMPGDDQTFMVKLIGEIGRDAFLVSHPLKDQSHVFVKEGQSWEFRAFYGTSVYRFHAVVEKVILSPYSFVLCRWPLETNKESRLIRTAKRVSCQLPVSLKFEDESLSNLRGVISNLSTGGLEIKVPGVAGRLVEKEQVVSLGFQVTLQERRFLINAKAKVMSKSEESEDELKFGMAFFELSDTNFAFIHAYVMDLTVHRIEPALYGANVIR